MVNLKIRQDYKPIVRNVLKLKNSLTLDYLSEKTKKNIYINHLKDRYYNPLIADVAYNFFITQDENFPVCAYDHYVNTRVDDMSVINLHRNINAKLDKIYPKTYKIRKLLIENNRISIFEDSIKPKMNKLQKLKIKLSNILRTR